MRLTFKRLSRRLACTLGCVALGLATTAGDARGAVVLVNGADTQASLVRWLSSGFVVDWNQQCNAQPVAGIEDQNRPNLPVFTPDNVKTDASNVATDDAATAREIAAVNSANTNAANTNAADDHDYLDFKYGRYGRHYGQMFSTNRTTRQSSDTSNKNSTATENENDTTTDGTIHVQPNTSSSLEEYYKYRYESLEEQYGKNAGDAAQAKDNEATEARQSMEADAQSGGDSATEDETADAMSDDDGDMAMTDALLSVVSRWVEDLYDQFGVSGSQMTRMLNWVR